MQSQSMQPMQSDTPVTITMTASEWNQVLAILGRGKFHAVAQLIGKIHQQATQQSTPSLGNGEARSNWGDATHVSD